MRDLFPEFASLRSFSDRRDYVERTIVDLIERGELWLTELMNQDDAPRQMIGDVIFGHGVSDGTDGGEAGRHVTTFHVPEEIKNHKVTISARDGKTTVKYVDGVKQIKGVVAGQRQRHKIPRYEDNVVDTKQTRVELGLREAWLCLKAFGEYVAFGGTAEDQKMNWLYTEANPMEQAKPRRGRPAASDSADATA